MDEIKNYWIQFAEGKITVTEMLQQTENKPELLDWLTSIADPKFKTYTIQEHVNEESLTVYTSIENPFDAKLQIKVYVHEGHGSMLGRHLNIHNYFSRVITTAFPNDNIVVDNTLDRQFKFMIDACPQYIGGHEVEHLLTALLDDLPEELSEAKRTKIYKDKVKALFHVTGKKFPYWVQDAEWPISPRGKPMRFLEQKRLKGKDYANMLYTQFIFEDVDTGETRVIDQFT